MQKEKPGKGEGGGGEWQEQAKPGRWGCTFKLGSQGVGAQKGQLSRDERGWSKEALKPWGSEYLSRARDWGHANGARRDGGHREEGMVR